MPDFICPTCGRSMSRDLAVIIPHTEDHIIDEVKKKHPEWVTRDGVCKMCYAYFKKQLHPE